MGNASKLLKKWLGKVHEKIIVFKITKLYPIHSFFELFATTLTLTFLALVSFYLAVRNTAFFKRIGEIVFETTTGFPEHSTIISKNDKYLEYLTTPSVTASQLAKSVNQQSRSIFINKVNIVIPEQSSIEEIQIDSINSNCTVPVCVCSAGIAHSQCSFSYFSCSPDHPPIKEVSTCVQCLEGFELVQYNTSGLITCSHSEKYCETYCDPYRCECRFGKPFVGHGCYRHGQELCASCDEGFILNVNKKCTTKKIDIKNVKYPGFYKISHVHRRIKGFLDRTYLLMDVDKRIFEGHDFCFHVKSTLVQDPILKNLKIPDDIIENYEPVDIFDDKSKFKSKLYLNSPKSANFEDYIMFLSDHKLYIFEAYVFFEHSNQYSRDGRLADTLDDEGWVELINSTMKWGDGFRFNVSMRIYSKQFYLRNSFSIPVRAPWLGGVIICQ